MAGRDEHILRAIQRDDRIVARFWQLISKGDSESACWIWHGPVSKRYPSMQVGRCGTAAARIAWWTATGFYPSGGRFHRTCDNELCVRPDHLAWSRGTSAERVLDPSGCFALSGVAVRVAIGDGERPQVFRFVSHEAASAMLLAG